jgi:hypothetical protein
MLRSHRRRPDAPGLRTKSGSQRSRSGESEGAPASCSWVCWSRCRVSPAASALRSARCATWAGPLVPSTAASFLSQLSPLYRALCRAGLLGQLRPRQFGAGVAAEAVPAGNRSRDGRRPTQGAGAHIVTRRRSGGSAAGGFSVVTGVPYHQLGGLRQRRQPGAPLTGDAPRVRLPVCQDSFGADRSSRHARACGAAMRTAMSQPGARTQLRL